MGNAHPWEPRLSKKQKFHQVEPFQFPLRGILALLATMKPESVPPADDVWTLCDTSECRRFSEHSRQHQAWMDLQKKKPRQLVYSICMPGAQVTQHEGLPVESSDGRFSKGNTALASAQQKQQAIFRCYPRHFSKGQQEHLISKLVPCFKT